MPGSVLRPILRHCAFWPVMLGGMALYSSTIRVPSQFPTIQAGINAASASTVDTVLVAPGTYNESISFGGKDVKVISEQGSTQTFIVAPTNTFAVVFVGSSTPQAMLLGFTVRSSIDGIYVTDSSPTVVSNVLINCGGGIYVLRGNPFLVANVLTNSGGIS